MNEIIQASPKGEDRVEERTRCAREAQPEATQAPKSSAKRDDLRPEGPHFAGKRGLDPARPRRAAPKAAWLSPSSAPN